MRTKQMECRKKEREKERSEGREEEEMKSQRAEGAQTGEAYKLGGLQQEGVSHTPRPPSVYALRTLL